MSGSRSGGGTVEQSELQILEAIQATSFTASPSQVRPFGRTRISWQIRGLPADPTRVRLAIGSTEVHGASGSMSFTITTTPQQEFDLVASVGTLSKSLASVDVTVDETECTAGSLPGVLISAAAKNVIDPAFAGRLTGTGSTVTLVAGGISIDIPVGLPDSGAKDGTMDIGIQLGVGLGPGGTVLVADDGVTVNVHLNTDLNVGSFCSNAMATLAQAFMAHIVDDEAIPAITLQLTNQVNKVATSAQAQDPLHRQYKLTSFFVTPDSASFLVCPSTSIRPPGLATSAFASS